MGGTNIASQTNCFIYAWKEEVCAINGLWHDVLGLEHIVSRLMRPKVAHRDMHMIQFCSTKERTFKEQRNSTASHTLCSALPSTKPPSTSSTPTLCSKWLQNSNITVPQMPPCSCSGDGSSTPASLPGRHHWGHRASHDRRASSWRVRWDGSLHAE